MDASQLDWRDFKSDRCTARLVVYRGYLLTECRNHMDGDFAALQVEACEPYFQRGESLGAFHIWAGPSYDTSFRTNWTDCMKKWGTKYFRDLNIYTPAGITRMGLSVAAALRIGEFVVYKTEESLLARRKEVLGL